MCKIDDLIGIKYTPNGRTKEDGFDCFGLVKEVYRREGIDIGEYYYVADDMRQVDNLFHGAIKTVRWEEITDGNIPVPALIGIRFNCPAGVVNHTAVYIGDGLFLHCRERMGVCIDRVNSPAWRKLIVGFYRWAL